MTGLIPIFFQASGNHAGSGVGFGAKAATIACIKGDAWSAIRPVNRQTPNVMVDYPMGTFEQLTALSHGREPK